MKVPGAKNRTGDIRDSLEQEILTGERLPGQRLDEQAIARRFDVSRTPVREALQQLVATGLVELQPYRGAFVKEISLSELVQMLEVMAELEGMAGRLAANRADDTSLARLKASLLACEEAARSGNPDTYYAENSVFHEAIYDGCGNDFLAAEAKRLHQRLKAYRRLQLRVPKRIGQSLEEHRRIVDAIVNGKSRVAETELKKHISVQGERFTEFVNTMSRSDAAE
ncbi:GntR family transcriptional regulator [Fulvimarina pelagi]|uniref:GntR family transcriptional regulator n=1 Tax=Fulvimarina pelagi TaxID=217511 RepID=UPI00030DFD0C|nr:GntR family transcriptional regulator [Fulvimarina pelagi]